MVEEEGSDILSLLCAVETSVGLLHLHSFASAVPSRLPSRICPARGSDQNYLHANPCMLVHCCGASLFRPRLCKRLACVIRMDCNRPFILCLGCPFKAGACLCPRNERSTPFCKSEGISRNARAGIKFGCSFAFGQSVSTIMFTSHVSAALIECSMGAGAQACSTVEKHASMRGACVMHQS